MTSKTHRLSRCHRHPTKPVTGFCASCLRERLAGIESSSDDHIAEESPQSPELRRIKSFSGGRADHPSSSSSDPRRRSCEIRAARSTLCELFNIDDDEKKKRTHQNRNRKLDADSGNYYGFEIKKELENDGDGAVRAFSEGFVCEEDDEETKTMKEFIDLELQCKKNSVRDFRHIAGSFCRRLRKWSGKRKLKKNHGGGGGDGLMGMEVEKHGGVGLRRFRETQSEAGEYGLLGRRSCDTDPRLSVDAGRMSLDDSRFSFEAARASWDGYLIGRACSRRSPMVPVNGVVGDGVLVEEEEEEEEEVDLETGEEDNFPGGSSQTRVYYSNSQRSRRRSFDRSNSRRKPSMADVDELRVVSNAKVSPATSELFYGAKVLITEKDLRNANLKSSDNVQSDCVMGSGSKDAAASGVSQRGLKKFHKWGKLWNKLGMSQNRREDKVVGEEVCNKPVAESWQKLRRSVNGSASESVSQKLIRSYSVSCRNPSSRMAGLVDGFGGGNETNGSVLNGRQEFMLQRNRSVSRYSPNNGGDTGLLRFYLTPLKSYRRSRSGRSSLKDLNPNS